MLMNKWELLKAYVDGMAAASESKGITKAIQKVQVKMDDLDCEEQAERERLMNLPAGAVQDNRLAWEKED